MAVKNTNPTQAFTLRLPEALHGQVKYWSEKKGISMNDCIVEWIELGMAYENRDYDLPTAEIARLNQLVESIEVLASNAKNLEDVVISGFDSLLNLTRGDTNYLLEYDDV